MVIHQLVEGIELHYPKEILPSSVTKNFEMLDVIPKPEQQHKDANDEQEMHRKSQNSKIWSHRS